MMNTVSAARVYFILPNEWNAPVVTFKDDASLAELPDMVDYFLERTFDGFLPLGNRNGSPITQDMYAACLGVKIDDADDNLQSYLSLSDLM